MSAAITPENLQAVIDKPATKVHLNYLDGIRGIAALYVVFHHFLLWNEYGLPHWAYKIFSWTLYGHFAVDVFITLSGFCLMLPNAMKSIGMPLSGGISGFLTRRARRILPPYWGALILAIALAMFGHVYEAQGSLSSGNIVAHILLLHNLEHDWSDSLDMALWSIATEWQIYFVFALVLFPIWQRFGIAITILVGFVLGLIPHFIFPAERNFDWACPWYVGLFAFGMAASLIVFRPEVDRLPERRMFAYAAILFFVPYVGLKTVTGQGLGSSINPFEWLKDTIGGGIAASTLIYFGLSVRRGLQSSAISFLQSKPLMILGSFSYSLYLVHCLVLLECLRIQSLLGLSPLHALLFRACCGIPIALGLSYLFYLAFERPFTATKPRLAP